MKCRPIFLWIHVPYVLPFCSNILSIAFSPSHRSSPKTISPKPVYILCNAPRSSPQPKLPPAISCPWKELNTLKQSTWRCKEGKMEKRIWIALEGKRQSPLEMAQSLQYYQKVIWMTPRSDDLEHSVPPPPLHFNKTPTNKTKPQQKTIYQPLPHSPKPTPYLLRKNCQHASYHRAGSQLISSPVYKYFEGEETFLSKFCLRFSESSEYWFWWKL